MAKRQGGILGDRAMVHKLYICPVKEVPGVTGAYDIVATPRPRTGTGKPSRPPPGVTGFSPS